MTLRLEADAAYQQQFDVQNRLVVVKELFSGDSTTFAYDAAGQRVKTNRPDGTIIHYPFPTYERELPREDPGSLSSAHDATVFSGLPTTNYGAAMTLTVGQTELQGFSGPAMEYWRSLLRFDLSSIPAGATLNSASLTLYCRVTIGTSLDVLVSPLSLATSEWTEDSVTWNNQPTAGSTPQKNQVMSSSSYTQYQIDVLAFVQAWHSGTLSNNGFQLRSGSGTNSERLVECHSSEYAGPGTGQQPRLTVDWDLPEVTRSTYSLAGQVVATRVAGHTDSSKNGLFYLHSDHLGSNSAMTKANGDLVAGSVSRYTPFGDWRTEPTAALTDIGYTGHKHNNLDGSDIGLIYMNARYYVVGVGRFASADTLVPDAEDPQSFNRYSYVNNRPTRFNDPTGHCAGDPSSSNDGEVDWACWEYLYQDFCSSGICVSWQEWIYVAQDSVWTIEELRAVQQALLSVQGAFGDIWREVLGTGWFFRRDNSTRTPAGLQLNFEGRRVGDDPISPSYIWLSDEAFQRSYLHLNLLHEIGHAVDWYHGQSPRNNFHRLIGSGYREEPYADASFETAYGFYTREYGKTRPGEAFADAFAAYVAPTQAKQRASAKVYWSQMFTALEVAINESLQP